jgi:hypothetical protein
VQVGGLRMAPESHSEAQQTPRTASPHPGKPVCYHMCRLDGRNMLTDRERRHYEQRNNDCRAIGFASYAAYLKSALWEGIRAAQLAAFPRCCVCDRPATQVHHKKYTKKVLEGRDPRSLFSVCGGCHRRAEYGHRGKLGPQRATSKLRLMRTLRAKRLGAALP